MWKNYHKHRNLSIFSFSHMPIDPQTEVSHTQNVLMSHQDGLIDLGLSGPTGLVRGEEHFDGNLFTPPLSHPHLSIAALAYLLYHLDLLSYSSLYLRGNTTKKLFRFGVLVQIGVTEFTGTT